MNNLILYQISLQQIGHERVLLQLIDRILLK